MLELDDSGLVVDSYLQTGSILSQTPHSSTKNLLTGIK